ncbi:LysR family transcriptional regulator [Ramlibacter albus]|uniref:LysR family transcriptional regulator n=1 Tax=Ramlibacter albus TaxID=2079448 RepID=A0A923MAW1_9BURK|nr:LysR family transcriptional regulator [Ramlibacter albus]MBC5767043.1 LysR family transcriptional regulator [Ramlibacter albus]
MTDIDISKIRRLDFNLLLVFQQLLVHRRTTVVAERLGLSQSAVSHALARLREVFGEPLFLRRSDGLRPTQAALLLGPRIDSLLALAAETVDAGGRFEPGRSQRLFRIATNDYVAAILGPLLQSAFQREAPHANFSVRFATGTEALDMLDADGADLVVGRFDAVRPGVDATVLSRDVYHAVVRRHHPQLKRGDLTMDKYLALPHLLVSFHGEPYGPVDQALARLGHRRTIMGSVPMFLSALSIVGQGDLIATVPRPLAERYAATFGLRHMPLPFEMDLSTMLLVRHGRSSRDAGLDWLTEVIRVGWPRVTGARRKA